MASDYQAESAHQMSHVLGSTPTKDAKHASYCFVLQGPNSPEYN